MANIVQFDRVEYTIEHIDYGSYVINEPDGWQTDDKEYERVKDYDGIFTKFSNKLKFYGEAKDLIKLIYGVYGVNTDLILKRRERHPITNRWLFSYIGYLDLTTYELEGNSVSLKFNSSGLEDQLKSRATEKIEIERLDTLDGDVLEPLKTETVNHPGRRIFLKTTYKTSGIDNAVKAEVKSNAGNTRGQTVALPITLDVNEHQVISQTPTFQSTGSENVADLGMPFFTNIDRNRTFNIKIKANWDAFFKQFENVQWCRYKVCVTIYENGLDFNLKQRIVLYEMRSQASAGTGYVSERILPEDVDFPYPEFTLPVDVSYENPELKMSKGESLVFEIFLKSDLFGSNTSPRNNAGVRVFAKNFNSDITIEEDSFVEPSTSKIVMAYELGERLTKVITSRNDAFYSEALGRYDLGFEKDGVDTGALNGYAHGQWIRNFDKEPQVEDNKYKAFTTTFRDFTNHLNVAWHLGVGIEKVGLKERIRIEDKKFFYNTNVTIHIGYKDENGIWVYPIVNKLKTTPATEYIFSSIEIGYTKGAENEEAMGLDEPNTLSTFTTPITKIKNTYTRVSKYITGSYPIEFIRRKPKKDFSTTDHPNDKEIFGMDLKRGINGIWEKRRWQDDFETAPTGVFSPETITNIRLSVVNILIRQGWEIASTMTKELTKFIRYGSSEGNSGMTTQLIGGQPYKENGEGDTTEVIKGSELEKARYQPEWNEFEYPVDITMIEQIEGSTLINGKSVPNFYGLARYRNDEGDLVDGFMFNIKPNGNGKWKTLKSNR